MLSTYLLSDRLSDVCSWLLAYLHWSVENYQAHRFLFCLLGSHGLFLIQLRHERERAKPRWMPEQKKPACCRSIFACLFSKSSSLNHKNNNNNIFVLLNNPKPKQKHCITRLFRLQSKTSES